MSTFFARSARTLGSRAFVPLDCVAMHNSNEAHGSHARFIHNVHADSPGLTERSIGAARTPEGHSSYQAFCALVDPRPGQTVIDLACGNGPLGELVAERIGDNGRLIAVDPSGAELALAAQRLRRFPTARFLEEAADHLSLPDASADLVLCHMAFMLFSPLAPAIAEIARVLKPGGTFAAVIPALRRPTDLFRECAGVLKAALVEERHDLAALSGGTVPMASVDDLQRLFPEEDWENAGIRTHDLDVSIAAAPEALVDTVAPAFYNYRLLSPAARSRVAAQWVERFRSARDASGQARFHVPLAAFLVRRK